MKTKVRSMRFGWMTRAFLLALLLLIFVVLQVYGATSGKRLWVRRYNGPVNGSDVPNAIAVDSSGNLYVTGYSYGSGTGYDYATIKYDSSGKRKWVRRYNGPGNGGDEANAIVVDSSGNVYVTGYSAGSGTSTDYATIKYDSDGKRKWVRRYNGPGNGLDIANAIAVDSSGNVYVTGHSIGSGTSYDYTTIKYDSSGKRKWVRRYNGPVNGLDMACAIAVDSSGNVYVTGYSAGSGTSYDYTTIKYDSSGKRKWVRRYNGPPGNGSDEAKAIAVDSSGNVYVTGYSIGSGTSYDYTTIKYDSSGKGKWVRRYNGPVNGSDVPNAIAVDSSGNLYVTGYSYGSGTSTDYTTIKYDSSGKEKWVRRYNGPANGNDVAKAIAVDSSGNVYVTGYSRGSGTSYDYTTIKYDSSGKRKWVRRYNGPVDGSDEAHAIAVDANGVYVTGHSPGSVPSNDYATIKYAP